MGVCALYRVLNVVFECLLRFMVMIYLKHTVDINRFISVKFTHHTQVGQQRLILLY